jgi:penicillin-binding protein 1C
MQLIYPRSQAQLYIPIDLDGEKGKAIFKATHREENAIIYWSIDGEVVGETKTFHNLELSPTVGKHRLVLVDVKGNRLEQAFEILGK